MHVVIAFPIATMASYMSSPSAGLAMVNDIIVARRMYGAYRSLLRKDTDKAVRILNDTINVIRAKPVEDKEVVIPAVDLMYRALVNIARDNIREAHASIRTVHYMVASRYMGDGAEFVVDA